MILLMPITMRVGRGKVCPAPLNISSKTGMTKSIKMMTTMMATPIMVVG